MPINDLVSFADSQYKGPTAVIAIPSVRGSGLTGWSTRLRRHGSRRSRVNEVPPDRVHAPMGGPAHVGQI